MTSRYYMLNLELVNRTDQYFQQSELDECEFESKLAICSDLTRYANKTTSYVTSYDITYVLKWMEFIGPIVTFPIVSALSFILNLIVILVIKSKDNKKAKLFESKIFQFILLNSSFNCVECLICELKLMSMCLDEGSIFCSNIRTYTVTKYATITIGYLSETIKTCSILTGLLFSLQRYVETSQTKNVLLNGFAKSRIHKIAILVIFSGLTTSLTKLVEYQFNTSYYDSPSPFRQNVDFFSILLATSLSSICFITFSTILFS